MHFNDRILAVDDNADNLLVIKELLEPDYTVLCVESGEEAITRAPDFRPNLVLLDMMMLGLNGKQTCHRLRAMPELRGTKIVMLSARTALNDRLASYNAGAVDYITKPFDHQEVLAKVRAWMQMAYQQQIDDIWREAEETREAVGLALTTLVGFRDTETGDHLFRMRWYSQALAEQLAITGAYQAEIDEAFLRHLYRASPLHDIGKVGIPDAILRKAGPLTAAEFETIKQHTVIGSEVLAQATAQMSHADFLPMAVEIARHHHERFDGKGYPDGLAGLTIPLAARIVSVADVFDALTSERVYKRAFSVEQAAQTVIENAGTQFDPEVVAAFRLRLDDFAQACSRFADRHNAPLDDRIGDLPGSDAVRDPADHVEYTASLGEATYELENEDSTSGVTCHASFK
jgi:putative two-component system response regulator